MESHNNCILAIEDPFCDEEDILIKHKFKVKSKTIRKRLALDHFNKFDFGDCDSILDVLDHIIETSDPDKAKVQAVYLMGTGWKEFEGSIKSLLDVRPLYGCPYKEIAIYELENYIEFDE